MLNVHVGLHVIRLRGICSTKVKREAECLLSAFPVHSWGFLVCIPWLYPRCTPGSIPWVHNWVDLQGHTDEQANASQQFTNFLRSQKVIPHIPGSISIGSIDTRSKEAPELCSTRKRIQSQTYALFHSGRLKHSWALGLRPVSMFPEW